MTLVINKWCGRLGNNILQIVRCIHYAKVYNFSHIDLPVHLYLKDNKIIIKDCNMSNTISNTFFNIKNMGVQDPTPNQMKIYFQKYINPIIKLNINPSDNENILHIHIRSGDIFSPTGGHPYYVQPPLKYYIDIINSKKWEKIIVVYEDAHNPCVKGLANTNFNIHFQSSSLINDIEELCQSTNLVVGFGTFGYMIYLMNNNLKNLYIPVYVLKELPKGSWGDIILNVIELPNYIKCGEWKNTSEQRQIMLNYK